jgi:hypothetical protein
VNICRDNSIYCAHQVIELMPVAIHLFAVDEYLVVDKISLADGVSTAGHLDFSFLYDLFHILSDCL